MKAHPLIRHRFLVAGMGALFAVAGNAAGQAVYSCPSALDYPGFDDGGSEAIWKISNPSGPTDYFSVDYDATLSGRTVVGLAPALEDTNAALLPTFRRVGLYGDNLALDASGATPDLNSIVTEILGGGIQTDRNCDFTPFSLPGGNLLLGGSNIHLAFQFQQGDSSLWVCGDSSSTPSGRSYLSADGYLTAASPVARNHMLRVGVVPASVAAGTLLINGATSLSTEPIQPVALSFYGAAPGLPWALFTAPPLPVVKVGPILPTGFGGPTPSSSTFCAPLPCYIPVFVPFAFNAFYRDLAGKIKKSNTVTLTVLPSSCGDSCFGQRDDDSVDLGAFRVGQPAGSQDYFSVKHGNTTTSSVITRLTAVEVAVWDFCGTAGPGGFAEVGIYPADLVADAAGRIPDLSAPLATVGGASAPVTPGAFDWGYPAQFFDTPNVTANTSTIYHAAVHWVPGDSCLWVGGDSTGTGPGPCGVLPNSSSFTSSDAYGSTLGVASSINWMIKIDWF